MIALERKGDFAAAARIEGGVVTDLLLDAPADQPQPEELHLAVIERVAPALDACFLRLTGGATGWLRGARGKSGEARLVQVSRWADPGKAAPLTDRLVLKGRLALLTPGAPGANVSRAVRGAARGALQEAARAALSGAPDGVGLVVRTEAAQADPEELIVEARALIAEWGALSPEGAAPRLLRAAPDAETRALRDWPGEVVRGEAFERLGVWDAIAAARRPRVDLPGGGWMSVEATSAVIAVDVNTGEDFAKGAASRANLAACAELPRQLRLRGLGGVALIDLAPIKKGARQGVDLALKRAFEDDPVETRLAGWTPLGNVELNRKRERRPLRETAAFWEATDG